MTKFRSLAGARAYALLPERRKAVFNILLPRLLQMEPKEYRVMVGRMKFFVRGAGGSSYLWDKSIEKAILRSLCYLADLKGELYGCTDLEALKRVCEYWEELRTIASAERLIISRDKYKATYKAKRKAKKSTRTPAQQRAYNAERKRRWREKVRWRESMDPTYVRPEHRELQRQARHAAPEELTDIAYIRNPDGTTSPPPMPPLLNQPETETPAAPTQATGNAFFDFLMEAADK